MIKNYFLSLFLSLTILNFSTVQAWTHGGHLVAADVAYKHLDPQAKEKCDELIDLFVPFYPASDSFVKSAVWLDIVHLHDFKVFWQWHFTNSPFDPEGILTDKDHAVIDSHNNDGDILYGIGHAIKVLKSSNSNNFEKALMLRYLVHTAADAHQPLHSTSLYNSTFPSGDQGGNLFKIDSPLSSQLHLLWDLQLGGIIPNIEFTEVISQESLEQVSNVSNFLISQYPKESFSGLLNKTPKQWTQESHDLAISDVYTLELGSAPSEEYLLNGQKVCEKRIVLAGYRLAELLNEIFAE